MVNEPNFDGEKMKLPTETFSAEPTPKTERAQLSIIVGIGGLLLLIFGGLLYWYYLGTTIPTPPPVATRPSLESNREPETPTATAQTESFGALSTSDELNALEADIESTNLDSLENELIQIDTELSSAQNE